jgi:hypothetical protein
MKHGDRVQLDYRPLGETWTVSMRIGSGVKFAESDELFTVLDDKMIVTDDALLRHGLTNAVLMGIRYKIVTEETPMTNPTPPNPPEVSAVMPKADIRRSGQGVIPPNATWFVEPDTGTTSIERYAQQQRERAEKAETENARLREALEKIANEVRWGIEYRAIATMAIEGDSSIDLEHPPGMAFDSQGEPVTDYGPEHDPALHGSPAAGGKDEDE